jgi:NADH-quinone oxidoreductase subunit M
MIGFFPAPKLMGAISATAVIFAAMYLLTMYQKLMFGPLDKPENRAVRDIRGRETLVFGLIVVAALVMGIVPQPILARSEKSVNAFITGYRDRLQEARRTRESPAHVYPPLPAAAAAPAPNAPPAAPPPAPAPVPGGGMAR